jgi:hypothetical protein
MKATELLESRGIAARKKAATDGEGVIAVGENNTKIELQDIIYLPPERGRYENDDKGVAEPLKAKDKTIIAISDWAEENGVPMNNVNMVNQPGPSAALSVWKNVETGETVVYGRYTNNLRMGNLGVAWSNTDFYRDTGFQIENEQTKVENFALKPTDLLETNKPLSVEEIIAQVTEGVKGSDKLPNDLKKIVPRMLQQVASGEVTFVKDAANYRSAIEKYVAEYGCVVALLTGNFLSGNYEDVQTGLLAPQELSWADLTKGQFPASVVSTLVDSYLVNEDGSFRLAISSKQGSGGGAAASLASIDKIYKENEATFSSAFKKKYAQIIEAIDVLSNSPADIGIYKLGVGFRYVNTSDVKLISTLIKNPGNKSEKILTSNLKKVLATYPSKDHLPTTLAHPGYNMGYRLLAGLARLVAKRLNNQDPTKFFTAVLNKSSFIQVYAKTQKRGNDLAFIDFNVVWPAKFTGTVYFDANTNYYSTDRPKGRMTFKFAK